MNIRTRAILLVIMLVLLYRKMVEHNFRNVLIGRILSGVFSQENFSIIIFSMLILINYYLKGNKATIIFTFTVCSMANAAPKKKKVVAV